MTPHERLAEYSAAWSVTVDNIRGTATSLIGFGSMRGDAVVVKVAKQHGDEWRAGEILAAFNGSGAVRVLRHAEGISLLERATPGHLLVELSLAGRDGEATDILADVIRRMSSGATECAAPTAAERGQSFATYAVSGDTRVPKPLVADAVTTFTRLCDSQTNTRLLHGDLQHYNVLRDEERGWLAIDPKGVVAEVEYEIGAMLRNPSEQASVFLDPTIIERRVSRLASALELDRRRILEWGFAQAVLSAIWEIEDGYPMDARHPTLQLAAVLERILRAG